MAENRNKPQYLLKIIQNIKYKKLFHEWIIIFGKIRLKIGLKMHIKRFKNQKFSYPGEGDTPSPGSHPSCLVPQRKNSALWALQVPTQMEICTFIDLAEFIREMAENNHTFGGSPILIYGHPAAHHYLHAFLVEYS